MNNKENFVSVFWGWNGEITEEDIKTQLLDFKNKGINNVFVHARAGLKIEYMGETWISRFKYALEIAKELKDVYVWIYDENGWPSGFGGGIVYKTNDEFKERYLLKIRETYGTIKSYDREIVKVFDDNLEDVTDKVDSFKDSDVYNFVLMIVNDYYIDVTNKDAIKCFIDTTHEVYKKHFKEYFGNVIPGVFTDEPHSSIDGIPVGKYILEEYENRFGHSLFDDIKYLLFDIEGSETYRYNYRKMHSELFKNNYTTYYNNWCKENNLILTGHYTCEEGLTDQVPTSGKISSLYDEMGLIGIDALGNRLCPLPLYRRAFSSSWQNGKREVLIETFAGTGYDSTFDELLRIWSYEAINGVTHPCLSISVMSLLGNRKRDYPNYFSNQVPWWDESKTFFDKLKFIRNEIKGERKQKVLLVEPISSIYLANRDEALNISSDFRVLNESLFYNQIDFDYADEDKLSSAKIENGKLIIGECGYENVIYPHTLNIESGVLEKLKECSLNSINVFVVGDLPRYIDGVKFDVHFDFTYIPIVGRYNYIRKTADIYNLRNDVVVSERETRKPNSKLAVSYREFGEENRIFILNPMRNEETTGRIVVSGKKKAFVNNLDSSKTELKGNYNFAENTSEFVVDFKEMEYKSISLIDGEPMKGNDFRIELENLYPYSIKSDLNNFVIDKVSISINGGEYDEKEYSIFKTKKLYQKINGQGKTILKVKYEFDIEEYIDKLFAVIEDDNITVFVNDNKVEKGSYAFYKDAYRYDISKYITIGLNSLIIEKHIKEFYDPIFGKDVFQSIGNIYSLPFYIESVILEGRFTTKSSMECSTQTHIVSKDDFKLYKDIELKAGDVTANGYNFFRGKIRSLYHLNYDGNGKVVLSFDNTYATSNVIIVNDRKIAVRSKDTVDVTEYLHENENEIEFIEYSGLRNTFGPFHHVYGKHYYTGPSVFEGYAEWQDYVIYPELKGNTYVEDYSFTHLIIPTLKVIKKKDDLWQL